MLAAGEGEGQDVPCISFAFGRTGDNAEVSKHFSVDWRGAERTGRVVTPGLYPLRRFVVSVFRRRREDGTDGRGWALVSHGSYFGHRRHSIGLLPVRGLGRGRHSQASVRAPDAVPYHGHVHAPRRCVCPTL